MIKMFSKNHQICLIFVFKIFYVSLKVDSDSEQPEKIHLWLELRIGDSSVLFFNRGAKRVPHRISKVFNDIFRDYKIDKMMNITFRKRRMQSLIIVFSRTSIASWDFYQINI